MAYSCSTFGSNTSAIGLLSNDSLSHVAGWKDEGCIIASKGGRDNWNAIDPNMIIDDKGHPWLTWGLFWDGIQLIALDTTLHVKAGAQPRTIARRFAFNRRSVPEAQGGPKKAVPDITISMRVRMPSRLLSFSIMRATITSSSPGIIVAWA